MSLISQLTEDLKKAKLDLQTIYDKQAASNSRVIDWEASCWKTDWLGKKYKECSANATTIINQEYSNLESYPAQITSQIGLIGSIDKTLKAELAKTPEQQVASELIAQAGTTTIVTRTKIISAIIILVIVVLVFVYFYRKEKVKTTA